MKSIEARYQRAIKMSLNSKATNDQSTIYINNQSESIKNNRGIRVPPVWETSLVLKREIEKRLPKPYSNRRSEYTFA